MISRYGNKSLEDLARYYCPSLHEINLYIDGIFISTEMGGYVESHLDECPECMEEYQSLRAFKMREVEEEL